MVARTRLNVTSYVLCLSCSPLTFTVQWRSMSGGGGGVFLFKRRAGVLFGGVLFWRGLGVWGGGGGGGGCWTPQPPLPPLYATAYMYTYVFRFWQLDQILRNWNQRCAITGHPNTVFLWFPTFININVAKAPTCNASTACLSVRKLHMVRYH